MKTIAKILVQNNAVKTNFKNPFVWASGIHSPIYCDCRELISLPDARKSIIKAFLETFKKENINPEVIAGTATAGIPWASFIAQKLNLPLLYVRSKPKDHGQGKMVEGRTDKGKKIVVIEDAFSTAGSSIVSTNALREELQATVKDILGIFSWSTPLAEENAKKGNVILHPLTNFAEITEALLEAQKITAEEKQELLKFNHDPKGWWQTVIQKSN